jgi:late competence protein required for DNA uptake (superfamily II DNA/RNA helicase)
MALSKSEKRKRCSGCRSNYYNMGRGYCGGPHDATVTCDECWNLKSATACHKLVHYSPSEVKPHLKLDTLSCWHNELGSGQRCNAKGVVKRA